VQGGKGRPDHTAAVCRLGGPCISINGKRDGAGLKGDREEENEVTASRPPSRTSCMTDLLNTAKGREEAKADRKKDEEKNERRLRGGTNQALTSGS